MRQVSGHRISSE